MIDLAILRKARADAADSDYPLYSYLRGLPMWKEAPDHEMQNDSVQQEFCACCDRNVEPVILMSTGLIFCCIFHLISLL